MQFKVISASDLTHNQREQIAKLCFEAFDEDPWSQYAFMQNAVHVIGLVDNVIVSHALWTKRNFTVNTLQNIETAYVEYVTTDLSMRGKGYASQLIKYLIHYLTLNQYSLAALQPEDDEFYKKLGWLPWKGNLYVQNGQSLYQTEDVEILLYPLNNEIKAYLKSQHQLLCTDWREGELW
ncbi:GNAT family N-acetyltransferase [Acinetobacter soli]|uniref:GNAT family N-acetyltransferase n=1 Tax=Acinetobacter soli TaxID=487316 RepID=UPI00370C9053